MRISCLVVAVTERDHGPCCICEGTDDVNVLVLVTKRGPVPGTGWGCVVCHRLQDGAIAVICGKCAAQCEDQAEAERRLKFVCKGYVVNMERTATFTCGLRNLGLATLKVALVRCAASR